MFGSRAIDSMRLEKGHRHWKADQITEYNPYESRLRRFVSLTLDCSHAAAHSGASVSRDGNVVGTVTSAEWGRRTGENIAMAFIDPACAAIDTVLEVEVIGALVKSQVVQPCLYDPKNQLVRHRPVS